MTDDDPRSVDLARYPAAGTERERLAFLLNYAVLAPSSHNSQPWRFLLGDDHVSVYADRARRLPVVDPDDRELTISCGASIETLLVACRQFGHLGEVAIRPDPDDPDLLAHVSLNGSYDPTALDRLMFAAIPSRATDRFPFENRPVPTRAQSDLQEACTQFGVDLHLTEDPQQKHVLADLVAEGDRRQFSNEDFRNELADWVHSRRAASRDGLSAQGFGMPDVLSGLSALAIRTFDMGDQTAARDEKIAEGSPLLAILFTASDTIEDWIVAGRALAATLLTAAAHGLAASYLNQPIEVPDLRPTVAEFARRRDMPQIILRLGYPSRPAQEPTSRRPVSDVLDGI